MELFDNSGGYIELSGILPEDRNKKKKEPKSKTLTPMQIFEIEAKKVAVERFGTKEIVDIKLINSSTAWVSYIRGKEEHSGFVLVDINWADYGITPETHPQYIYDCKNEM